MIKIIFITVCLYFVSLSLKSQVTLSMKMKFSDTVVVKKYEPEENDFKYKKIEIQPGEYNIVNTATTRILNDETITQVDLVYSDYPKDDDFSELNRNRIIELFITCPNAFNKQTIKWRIIKQSGVKNSNDLKNYFHGFVIYFRPLIPFQSENEYFKEVLSGKQKPKDSTITKVLTRNSHWSEMLCVTDVTGSMSPYTIQLLLWAKLNEKSKTFKQFVFFNDNDILSTDQSKTQDTSGIWSLESFNADKIFNKIIYSMEKGGHIENDLEAIFFAVKKYPNNIKNIVLIADNWEDPCDMHLLPKLKELKIPIRVVICGVNSVLNSKYLEIAYATNGSVHTIEQDLIDMGKINDGSIIKMEGLKFKLQNGKFIPIN